MRTHLTLTVHADSAVAAVFTGRAVARRHHQLTLAVGGGAVEIARVAGDVHVVVYTQRRTKVSAKANSNVSANVDVASDGNAHVCANAHPWNQTLMKLPPVKYRIVLELGMLCSPFS